MIFQYRDLLIGFSAANLAMIGVWRRLIFASPSDRFLLRDHAATDWTAALLTLLLLGGALWSARALARMAGGRSLQAALKALPGLALLTPLTAIFGLSRFDRLGHAGLTSLYLLFLVVSLVVLVQWRRQADLLLLLLSPFLLLTVSQTGLRLVSAPAEAAAQVSGKPAPAGAPAQRRLLWVVFDALDQRLAFDQRPPDVALPEFDRLRAQSLAANQAERAGDNTVESVSAMLTGTTVLSAQPVAPNRVLLKSAADVEARPLDALPNVFRRARERGWRAAAAGWHFPYCRLFAGDLVRCKWEPRRDPAPLRPGLLPAVAAQLGSLAWWPFPPRLDHRAGHISIFESAKEWAADPRLELVYVHVPVPHAPPIYDRERGQLTILTHRRDWYFSNLVLADQLLGALRRELEGAGLWENTSLLITADHNWLQSDTWDGRKDTRVPLIVRLAGDDRPLAYQGPVHTSVTGELALSLLAGEVNTAEELSRWLEQR